MSVQGPVHEQEAITPQQAANFPDLAYQKRGGRKKLRFFVKTASLLRGYGRVCIVLLCSLGLRTAHPTITTNGNAPPSISTFSLRPLLSFGAYVQLLMSHANPKVRAVFSIRLTWGRR